MIIKNKQKLSFTPLRSHALNILESGIQAVLPESFMKHISYTPENRALQIYNQKHTLKKGRIFIIGAGNAAATMAKKLEQTIGTENITDGIVLCETIPQQTKKIQLLKLNYPLPSQNSIDATKKIRELKEKYKITEKDTFICLLSGDSSAMLSLPAKEINLEDQQDVIHTLIHSGASIQEVATVRNHISQIQGGFLGKYFQPATVISLILSGVVHYNLSLVDSGFTTPDTTTFSDAQAILTKHKLLQSVSKNILRRIGHGIIGQVDETPKKLDDCHNYVIANNQVALQAMELKSKELGFSPYILTSTQEGDPSIVAKQRCEEISKLRKEGFNVFLMGAKMTPKLPENHGKGGRNQQFITQNILEMQSTPGVWTVASLSSSGYDSVPNVSGAIIDNESIRVAKEMKLDISSALEDYNSHALLEKLGASLIQTNPTNTNVFDLIIYIFNK